MRIITIKKNKIQMKNILLFMLMIALICIMPCFTLISSANEVTTAAESDKYGSYELIMPTAEEDTANSVYSVNIELSRVHQDGTIKYHQTAEVYYVVVTDSEGNTVINNPYVFSPKEGATEVLTTTITDIPVGSTVSVNNMIVAREEYASWGGLLTWTNFDNTSIKVNITNQDPKIKNIVLIDGETPTLLVPEGTLTQNTKVEKFDLEEASIIRETQNTLLSVSGFANYYDDDFIKYLLSGYNVVSFDEINSTHIVGPIIAQNMASRTLEKNAKVSYLAASDYSKGIPSYIGDFNYFVGTEGNVVGVQLNYDFDLKTQSGFVQPYLYTDEQDLRIMVTGDGSSLQDKFVLIAYDDDPTAVSPNNTGHTETYQNDDFIDFDELAKAMNASSLYILENGNAEAYKEVVRYEYDSGKTGTYESGTIRVYNNDELVATLTHNNSEVLSDGRSYADFLEVSSLMTHDGIRLKINFEESWTITNAVNLQEVDMALPSDYDYYDNPYLSPTTINFSCEYINPAVYNIDTDGDGVKEEITHSRLPYTLINGAQFKETLGANGEFGEVGNKIIWNMPYVNTDSVTNDNRLTVYHGSHNTAGHIVAPNAEFWNYDTKGEWLGGNINGSVIVKNFYSGIAEMHMWPYDGLAEKAVVYGVTANKIVNGDKPNKEFNFILTPVLDESGNIPNGILNSVFPMTATSRLDDGEEGLIKFSSIAFNEVGTYEFILKEDTTKDTVSDNITYDLTEYKVKIEIDSVLIKETVHFFVSAVSKYKIVDSNGVPLANEELLHHDDFTYEDDPNHTTEQLGSLVFLFNNKISEEGTVSVSFHKKSYLGNSLAGAKFFVRQVDDKEGTINTSGGYYESVTSGNDGTILIENLEKNHYYKIWESEAPYGYIMGTGYWVFEVGPNGFVLSITAYEGAHEISIDDPVIYNTTQKLPKIDITLTKANQMGNLLHDVNFRLQHVILNDLGEPVVVVGGYDQTYISDENGNFTMTELEANQIYMLTETSTPLDHKEFDGYWLIEVFADEDRPDNPLTYKITEYTSVHKKVGEVVNNVIYNEKYDVLLPNTGGIGTKLFYTMGIALMLFSVILFTKKTLKFKRKIF